MWRAEGEGEGALCEQERETRETTLTVMRRVPDSPRRVRYLARVRTDLDEFKEVPVECLRRYQRRW